MKKILLSTLVLSLALSPAFALDSSGSKQVESSAAEKQHDADMFGFLIVVDKNEIAAAKKALEKSKNTQVKNFAKLMKEEHGKNLHDSLNMSHSEKLNLKDSELIINLKKKGKDDLVTLSSASPETFDKVYIDAMVKGHQEVLTMIDEKFMKSVTDPKAKAFLSDTKAHVEKHLQKAQEIQKSLK
ncbi:MAG: DUF4142 domain-containing protein [Proteobacteria bacterium]|nr:DUF4142 domain-containing protein [Pseudomonadota bacterium]